MRTTLFWKTRRFRLAALLAVAGTTVALGAMTAAAARTHSEAKSAVPYPRTGGVIIDINGPVSDPFFGSLKQGADAAAKQLGIHYQYSAAKDETNVVADYTALLRQAIGRRPAALVVGDFVPSAFDPFIKQAVKAGIPVVVVNSGRDTWESDGALTFIGEDPVAAGKAGGALLAKHGAKSVLCVDHVPANPALAQRCSGVKAGITAAGGKAAQLNIPSADNGNPAAVTQDIQGYLQSHSDVDAVVTLGAAISTDALAAVKNLGKTGKIKIGTFDVSTAILDAIKSGQIDFVVDQQGYLQGYLSLQIAAQYLRYGVYPTSAINTSGVVIDKSNVTAVLAVQKKYPGLRGAN